VRKVSKMDRKCRNRDNEALCFQAFFLVFPEFGGGGIQISRRNAPETTLRPPFARVQNWNFIYYIRMTRFFDVIFC
jgi:hypothetical protein